MSRARLRVPPPRQRTVANRDALLTHLGPLARGIPLVGFTPSAPPADLPPRALVINATSAGLKNEDPLPIDLGQLPAPGGVFDMIYNPAETKLLAAARTRGLPTANGLSMLIHQGARALEIWSGMTVPVAAMRAAVRPASRDLG